jgi:hypothetical protein
MINPPPQLKEPGRRERFGECISPCISARDVNDCKLIGKNLLSDKE